MSDAARQPAVPPGAVLAVDLGARRVGLAVTDSARSVVLPLETLTRERKPSARLRRIARIGAQRGVTAYVVGPPRRPDGTEGPEAEAARAFAERLAERTGQPVHLVDERLTTVEAEEALRAAKVAPPQRREVIDQVAAMVMLESWLRRGGAA